MGVLHPHGFLFGQARGIEREIHMLFPSASQGAKKVIDPRNGSTDDLIIKSWVIEAGPDPCFKGRRL